MLDEHDTYRPGKQRVQAPAYQISGLMFPSARDMQRQRKQLRTVLKSFDQTSDEKNYE